MSNLSQRRLQRRGDACSRKVSPLKRHCNLLLSRSYEAHRWSTLAENHGPLLGENEKTNLKDKPFRPREATTSGNCLDMVVGLLLKLLGQKALYLYFCCTMYILAPFDKLFSRQFTDRRFLISSVKFSRRRRLQKHPRQSQIEEDSSRANVFPSILKF